ncbi:iron-sulfur cluster biosynthesis family protein [Brevibacillus migulae]|uniref:iron-sulfur cluster biosynthesis family protein n=1 Tax=Brevibacillus migulae TaxID=1644114 RepID=UPI00106DE1DE|nr:iron-sulfur cluster biosynthesis family protein [Brevibacillus migulae]
MKITLKQPALDYLHTFIYPEGQAIRIDAVLSGGCGCTYDVRLSLDRISETDQVIEQDGIPFCMNEPTILYMGDELTLQYQPGSGFTLYSPSEILGTKLSLQQ